MIDHGYYCYKGFRICTWMTQGMQLSGVPLILYGMILEEHRTFHRPFVCSLNELSDALHVSRVSILKALQFLVREGRITKRKYMDEEAGVIRCEYSVVERGVLTEEDYKRINCENDDENN